MRFGLNEHRPGRLDRDAGQHPEPDCVHHGFLRLRQVVTRQNGELWQGKLRTHAGRRVGELLVTSQEV